MAATPKSRYVAYGAIVAILAVGFGVTYLRKADIQLPTRSQVADADATIAEFRTELKLARKKDAERRAGRSALRDLTRPYWLAKDRRVPSNEVQSEVLRIGTRVGIQWSRMGAPKVMELSDHINTVQVQISATTTVSKLARFLREVENHEPRLIVQYCSVRPDKARDPSGVLVSARINAHVISEEASNYLTAEEETL